MELKDCKVAFKRDRKYFRGELLSGQIKKIKQFKHLGDIPKFDKYITIKFYIRKSKSKMDLKALYKDLNVDNLYLLVDEIPVAPRIRKSKRGKPDKEPVKKVYKVSKVTKIDRETISTPLSDDLTPKAWEKAFFKVKNRLCLECTKGCKQSARVTIVFCPKYKKRG